MKLLLLCCFLAHFAQAKEYFLAPNGSDRNPGSKKAPWLSLQKSIWKMKQGDTLSIQEGQYRETAYADLEASQKDKWTTIRAEPGAKVVFDGRLSAKEVLESSPALNGNIWELQLNSRWKWIDGLWVDGKFYRKLAKKNQLKPGTWFYEANSRRAFIYFDKDKNPTRSSIEFRLEAMLTVSSPYWIVEGITANHFNQYGIGAWKTHHIVIRNCEAHYNGGAGIESDSATDLLIEKNHTSYNGSEGGPGWASGIHLFDLTSPNNILRNNLSHHNWDPSQHHTDGNGFSIDKGYEKGGADVYNNIAYANGGRGLDIMETANVNLHHNTFYNNSLDRHTEDQGEVSLFGKTSLSGLRIHDNLLLATRNDPPLVIWGAIEPREVKADYNLYYNFDNPPLAISLKRRTTTNFSLENWKKICGQDGHSKTTDPKLENVLKDLFKPLATSPAFSSGSGINIPPVDFLGRTRITGRGTMGAIETTPGNLK